MGKIKGGYYIKAKCIQESWIAHAPPHFREIWDWLLRNVNWKDTKVCLRGQIFTSYKDIQEGLHWMVGWRKMTYSKSDCEKSMRALKKAAMIETQKTTRGLLITVLNYAKYQDIQNYEGYMESDRKATGELQGADTIQKETKRKEIKKEEIYIAPKILARGEGGEKLVNLESEIEKFKTDKLHHIQVLGLLMEARKPKIENRAQLDSFISRNVKAARALGAYSLERITEVMDYLNRNADYKWTLETVGKFINENLETMNTPEPMRENKKSANEYREWYIKEYGVEPIN